VNIGGAAGRGSSVKSQMPQMSSGVENGDRIPPQLTVESGECC